MRKSLRIALIGASRYPIAQPFAGGLEAHVWHLARALSAAGHDVVLFAAPGTDVGVPTSRLAVQTFTPSTTASLDVSMPPHEFLAEHHAYLGLMLELDARTDFDVIHNHSLHYLPIAMAPALHTPMLTTLHTPPTPWIESALGLTGGAGMRCVAVSAHTADSWRHVLPHIEVVSNGVDVRTWQPGPGGPELIWFGRFVPEKGAHLAIDAARRAGLPLRLAGPISDSAYFEEHIRPHVGGHVRYLGHLDQRTLAAAVGSSAATVVTPMWDEPYGLVVAESLACGTPVAAFRRGGIPEVLGPDAGVLARPGDTADLAEAIVAATRIPRTTARHRAETHCGASAMVDSYLDVYAEMTYSRRRPAA